MNEDELHTEKYFIGYIDLLGSKEKILSDKLGDNKEKWLNAVADIYEKAESQAVKLPKNNDSEKISVKIFSDNIVIAVKIHDKMDDDIKSLIIIFTFMSFIQAHALIDYKWLVRGSITIGDLYINDKNQDISNSFIWGEGLVNGYFIESELAIYPRIIIDKEVLEIYKKPLDKYLEEISKSIKYYVEDFDGLHYLNFLEIYNSQYHVNFQSAAIIGKLNGYIPELKREFSKELKIMQKIAWTEKYLNSITNNGRQSTRDIPDEAII